MCVIKAEVYVLAVFRSPKDINFDSCVRGYEELTISDLQEMPRTKQEAKDRGDDYYFTGFCTRGHLAIKHVKHGRCLKCLERDRRAYYEKNKEDIIANVVRSLNERYRTDPEFKAKKIMRAQVHRLVRSAKLHKATDTEELLGYTSEQFKANMESKFQAGMSWDNYGLEWEIDHITPVGLFEVSDLGIIKEINSLDNLMPIFKDDHKKKTKNDITRIMEFKSVDKK